MTLLEYMQISTDEVVNKGIRNSVKYPEHFEIQNIVTLDGWTTFDVYGLKSKSKAKVRVYGKSSAM